MAHSNGSQSVTARGSAVQSVAIDQTVEVPAYDRERIEDVGFMTAMTLVLLGNYAQTGHFGGPLAYTPYNVALHLGGPENGALRYDYRRPKHPFCDRFMLAGGHNIPTAYALWMIMGEAMAQKHAATGDDRYAVDPNVGMLPIDALGFRRGRGALDTLLQDHGLEDHPLFAQAKIRGIRSLAGHSETTDLTNDVNGGPSGIGVATAAGKAAFWDFVGADDSLKVIALEGEFAMTEGHAQELKTQALAQQVGKRLRVLLSYNNAGIDDSLVGGVIDPSLTQGYVIEDQWTSYGWNVISLEDGNDYDQIMAGLRAMEEWDPNDRRPIIVVGTTTKGWWPAADNGHLPGFGDQLVGYHSHPYELKMNEPYFVALAETFERRYGVEFDGIRDGPVADDRERLIQFKTNIDVAMSVLNQNGLGDWLADRLVEIGDSLNDNLPLRIDPTVNPFTDERLCPENIPLEPQSVEVTNELTGETATVDIELAKKPGDVAGTRRAISELIKWVNYVTDNRFITLAADLSSSINVEKGALWGHYDPVDNPLGTRMKAPIEEAGNASSAIGLVSQSASLDPDRHAGVWALSGTYGAFTPLMYLPARVWSQRAGFADSDPLAAAKGMYLIRDWDAGSEPQGTVFVQGSNSTVNLMRVLPQLEAEGVNVRVVAVVSEELFQRQPQAYRDHLIPAGARYDAMVVSTGTRRMPPVRDLGPLTDEYSLWSDWDNQWLTGGTEPDVIAEANLDADSIHAGIKRFAAARSERLARQREVLAAL